MDETMEETKVDSATEEIVAKEGSVAAEIEKISTETKKEPETVPLSVHLELKKDLKELKKQMKEAATPKEEKAAAKAFEDLTKKYSDVDEDFIVDVVSTAKAEALKEIQSKYEPVLKKQEQAEFDRAFDRIYDKAIADNPDLPKNIDKELVKELALTPKYNNTPVDEIIKKLYPQEEGGRATTENDMRPAADIVSDVVDINNLTNEQYRRIMEDPKARKLYYDKKDGLVK